MLLAYPEEDQEDVQERFKYHLLEAAKTDPTCYGPIGAKLHPPDERVDLEGEERNRVLNLTAMNWCGLRT